MCEFEEEEEELILEFMSQRMSNILNTVVSG